MDPTSIILHGPSSSGKSSLAKALQAIWPSPMFHVDLDAFELMAEGARLTSSTVRREAGRVICLNLQTTVRDIAATEFSLVMDFALRDAHQISQCIDAVSARRFYTVGVKCDLPAMEAREAQRRDRPIGLARAQFDRPEYARSYDLVVDSTSKSPRELATTIFEYVLGGKGDDARSG